MRYSWICSMGRSDLSTYFWAHDFFGSRCPQCLCDAAFWNVRGRVTSVPYMWSALSLCKKQCLGSILSTKKENKAYFHVEHAMLPRWNYWCILCSPRFKGKISLRVESKLCCFRMRWLCTDAQFGTAKLLMCGLWSSCTITFWSQFPVSSLSGSSSVSFPGFMS